jgi:dTDP-4-amino-4,6-dideoxygalactose transaminase
MERTTLRSAGAVVPFLDLWRMHEPVAAQLLVDMEQLVESGAFINGPSVSSFERAYAAYCGSAHCIGLASGLDALRLGLIASSVKRGSEVIVSASTFVATFEAIEQAGAIPVPVDVSDYDLQIDVEAVRASIGPRTEAVVPVHLYGQMADMREIVATAGTNGLFVLEDACQAHGASRDGLGAGAGGHAGAFSFYPGKNLGAFGDAGALVTDDQSLASQVRALREHGQSSKYRHDVSGYTARLDSLQALVLERKLQLLDAWNVDRKRVATAYLNALSGIEGLDLPPAVPESEPVWHLFTVRSAKRDQLQRHLASLGIATGIHYPEPPHLTAAFEFLGYGPGAFPVAESVARTTLSLPIFPAMRDDEIERVTIAVRAFFERG